MNVQTDPGKIDRPCIKINDKIACYDPKPSKLDKCTNIGGSFFCTGDVKGSVLHTTFQKEARKVMNALLYPKIRYDEARQIEGTFITYTIGFIASALVFTCSLYIKDAIDYVISIFVGVPMPILTLILIIVILTVVSMVLALIQYRATMAFNRTNFLETIAEKDAGEIFKEITKAG